MVSSSPGKKTTGEPIYRKPAHCLALRCFDGGFLEDFPSLFLVNPQEPRVLFGTPFAEHGLSGLSSPHTAVLAHTRTHARGRDDKERRTDRSSCASEGNRMGGRVGRGSLIFGQVVAAVGVYRVTCTRPTFSVLYLFGVKIEVKFTSVSGDKLHESNSQGQTVDLNGTYVDVQKCLRPDHKGYSIDVF